MPVKGQPIGVMSVHVGTVFAGGLVGALIEESATSSSRGTLCDRLNRDTHFHGERILAEECASLLRSSSKIKCRDVTVHPLDLAVPGTKEMEPAEQQKFKSSRSISNTYVWRGKISEWLKGPSVAGNCLAPGKRPLYLEVTLSEVKLNQNKNITAEKGICIRLIDPETGKIIGSSKTGMIDSFDISEVTTSSDLRTFESDFRRGMNKFARQMLADLGLL